MGSSTPTPALVGGTIDNDSLRRQKQEMGEALNRAHRATPKAAQVNGSTPVPSSAAPSLSVRRSMSLLTEQADTIMTDVNTNGTSATPQPQDNPRVSQPPTQAQQLPTPVQEIDTSVSSTAPLTNGITLHAPHMQASSPPKPQAFNYLNQSVVPMDRRFRDPGRGKSHSHANYAAIFCC